MTNTTNTGTKTPVFIANPEALQTAQAAATNLGLRHSVNVKGMISGGSITITGGNTDSVKKWNEEFAVTKVERLCY